MMTPEQRQKLAEYYDGRAYELAVIAPKLGTDEKINRAIADANYIVYKYFLNYRAANPGQPVPWPLKKKNPPAP